MLARTLNLIACTIGQAAPMPAISSMLAAGQFTFERHEVVTGSAPRQTMLTGFLLGSTIAELAVVHIDENDDRRLRIYAFGDGTWVPNHDATLGPDVVFVDVANIAGRDRLITYEPGGLNWFDPETSTERALVAVTSNFDPARRGQIHHVDITRDVNHDGRDDLVVPDGDGFWVFIQMSDGVFADPVKLGPSTDMERIYGADGYRYKPWSQSRVHEIDYDGDGRSDLVSWNEDHFEVHAQDARGLLAPVAETFTTDVAFDSDDLSALATGDMTGRVLHSLTDLNGDGVGDLVVHSLEGRRISNKHSTYEVHFGARAPDGGTAFASEVGVTFQSDGSIHLSMDRHDFDRDGQVDVMLTIIDVEFLEGSLWKRIKGFMGDDIWLDLEFYRMEGGLYPDKPHATRRIQLDGAPSHREPGWVPLEIVLRGGTHERRKTQERYLRAFNRTFARRGCDRRRPLRPAHWPAPQVPERLCRGAGAGPVRPAASRRGGRRAQRRGIHLAGRSQPGRQAGHPHAPPIHSTRCAWSPDAAAGNRAASRDDADGPVGALASEPLLSQEREDLIVHLEDLLAERESSCRMKPFGSDAESSAPTTLDGPCTLRPGPTVPTRPFEWTEHHIDHWYLDWHNVSMPNRKITVEVPDTLLERAQGASGKGVTATVRDGLRLVAAAEAYRGLRRLRGKVKLSVTLNRLREDRA